MKKLLIALGLFGVLVTAQAQLQTTTITLTGTNRKVLLDYGAQIHEIKLYVGGAAADGSATECSWKIRNAFSTNTTTRTRLGGYYDEEMRVGGYTNYSSYLTNWSYMYTNYFGGTNVYTNYNVLVTVTNLSPGLTNAYDIVGQATQATNTTTTITFATPYFAFRGLYITNSQYFTNTHGASQVTITYQPVL